MSEKTAIILHESTLQSWIRDASTFATFAGLIGIGVYADSGAMQWAGFFIAVMTVFSRAGKHIRRMTIPEARAYLETLAKDKDQ